MALTIEQLRSQFKQDDKKGSRPNNYYPFWNMKEGEIAIVRFLPDTDDDNAMGFMVEKLMHKLHVNGDDKKIPCMRMYDSSPKSCPICNVSAAYYKDDDKENGKKYWRQKQHVVQALVIDDPLPPGDDGEKHEGKVRFMTLSYQLFNIIKAAFESGELDEIPYAFEDGYNFAIKKTKQGDYATYAVGSNFVRKSSSLSDDEQAIAHDGMVELGTLLPPNPGLDKLEAMLEASMTGSSYDEDDAAETTDFKAVKKDKAPVAKKDKAPVVTKEDVADTDDDEVTDKSDEADDILMQIRNRQAKG
jgi:hypothetical protein